MSIDNTIDKFNEFELLNVPVNAAVYCKAIEDVSRFVIDLINCLVPVSPILSGFFAVYLLRMPAVRNVLGEYGSYCASKAAVGIVIDETLQFFRFNK